MTKLRVNVEELVSFFDSDANARQDSNPIKTLLGEELPLQLLVRYLQEVKKATATVVTDTKGKRIPCNVGGHKGSRLDGWVRVDDEQHKTFFYQVEVKMWSFHGFIKEVALATDCDATHLSEYKKKKWKDYWDDSKKQFRADSLQKVLQKMKLPSHVWPDGVVQPLACLWSALHPEGLADPFFTVPLNSNSGFENISVFSVSSYLRNLNENSVELVLDLPDAHRRIGKLKALFQAV